MKVPGLPEGTLLYIKPSRVLGFVLLGELVLFAAFVAWVKLWQPGAWLPEPPMYDAQRWIWTGAAMTAMLGWTVTAYVNVKNSIKQHTISTLLQSRVSATYMERADKVSKAFTRRDGSLVPVVEADLTAAEAQEKMEALRYVLNYFEFISLGVRHGDLHEPLMRGSMRGMLCNMYVVAKVYIDALRRSSPRVYEHLEWLNARWKDR